ncbi:MAG: hypothetical protein LBO72_05990 [Helicobacteraceae bacterium]|nr:hypothetical protein [Helicobacteraceae bacterium]
MSCFFLLAFHRFYGASEVRLFMPVIAAILLCLLVFSAQVISRKIALCVASALLIVVLPLNLLGAYNTHIISEFVFGELDSGDWQNYKNDIDRFVEISKKDDLNKFLLYQSLKKNK